jgi:hypothetical protein
MVSAGTEKLAPAFSWPTALLFERSFGLKASTKSFFYS